MKKIQVFILLMFACLQAMAATTPDLKVLPKILGSESAFNIQVLSNKTKGKFNFMVVQYGAYYRGSCNGGQCGCAETGHIAFLKTDTINDVREIEAKQLFNNCSDDERLMVGFNKDMIFIGSTSNKDKEVIPKFIYRNKDSAPKLQPLPENFSRADMGQYSILDIDSGEFTDLRPGFLCKNSKKYVEKQICSSRELAETDSEMSKAFRLALSQAAELKRNSLKAEQVEFINSQAKECKDIICIMETTQMRTKEINMQNDAQQENSKIKTD